MSLYIALAIVAAVGIFIRFQYGSEAIRYAAAALLVVLFLYCPTQYHNGFSEWTGLNPASLGEKVDRLAEIVSFGLLFTAAWIAGGTRGKRSE